VMNKRIARQIGIGAVGLAVTADITYMVASHGTPALATTAVLAAMLTCVVNVVFSGVVTGVRVRTVVCPKGCGFAITMPAGMAGTYQPVIDDHQCTPPTAGQTLATDHSQHGSAGAL
jgi:hypothetical protein